MANRPPGVCKRPGCLAADRLLVVRVELARAGQGVWRRWWAYTWVVRARARAMTAALL